MNSMRFRGVVSAAILVVFGVSWGAQAALLSDASVRLWREYLGFGAELGRAYQQLGEAAYQQQDYMSASRYFSVAHDLLPRETGFLARLGFAYKEIGEYEKAEELLFEATVGEPTNGEYWIWLGDAQRLLGKYEEAVTTFMTAVDMAPQAQKEEFRSFMVYTEGLGARVSSWEAFELHRDFAKRHDTARRWLRLIAEYYASLDVCPQVGFDENDAFLRKAWVHNNVGLNYAHIKDYGPALDHWMQSARLYREAKSPQDVTLALQSVALTYLVLADIEEDRREEHLRTAIAFLDQLHDTAIEGARLPHARYALGAKLLALSELNPLDDPAVVDLRAKVKRELPWQGPINDFSVASIAEGEAACRLKEGDYAGARIVYEMVLPYYAESGYLSESEKGARYFATQAYIYHLQGHDREALEATDSGLKKLLEIRQFLDPDAFNRSNNGKSLRYLYAARARSLVAQGDAERALEYLEEYKTQTRRDMLGSKVTEAASRTDYTTEEQLIRWRMPKLREQREAAYDARDNREMARLDARTAADEARLARLEKKIAFAPPGRLSLRQLETLRAARLKEALPSDTTLLHLILDQFGGVAVVLAPEGVSGVLLPEANDRAVSEALRRYYAGVEENTAQARTALAELYRMLIAPVRDKLKTRMLYVATDDLLLQAPLDALGMDGKALLDDFTVCGTPSGSYLAQALRQERNGRGTALAMLTREGSGEAMQSALGQFSSTETLAGNTAVESRLWATGAAYDVLHLSCPVEYFANDVMLSNLRLGKDDSQDGSLHLADLLTLSLPASLVVLDAAPLDGAKQVPGRAIGACVEGFMHTGAPALVYNLYAVSPKRSGEFFETFYREAAKGSKAEALRAAKLAYRAAHPDDLGWTAYVLSGDGR